MTNAEKIIEAAKNRRAARGLFLEIAVPERPEPFTCYPSTPAKFDAWRKGFIERGCFILNG